uniref:amidase family protein n=1 Tax=Sphingomonas bacterium TaxID=1895847 RepID=UPI0020C6CCED
GWFARNLAPEMAAALDRLARALGCPPLPDLPGVAQARSAAFLMTAYEGGRFHLPELRERALDYDPATRDRLIAGAALPEAAYREALAYRERFRARMMALFDRTDVLIAPSTHGPAPPIADPTIMIDGAPAPARANLGLYTQPISFLGLPVVAAPLPVAGLPMGVQLIGRPGADAELLGFAGWCEAEGLLGQPQDGSRLEAVQAEPSPRP